MNILFVTDFTFPYGEAWSARARNLYKLFKACGHDVHMIAKNSDSEENKNADGYDVEYVDFNYNSIKAYTIGKCRAYLKAVNSYIESNSVDVLISSNMSYVYYSLMRVAKKNGIPYVMEQSEWFDVTSFYGRILNPKYWIHSYDMHFGQMRCDGVIAISSYLEEHSKNKINNVVRIPSIIDISEYAPRLEGTKKSVIDIGMCGSIGGSKENLKSVLMAMSRINKDREYIHYHLYGPSERDVVNSIGKTLYEKCKSFVTVYGKIPQKEIFEKIKLLDYTVLVRPERRSSNAGFSTKLAESVALGTPCICNCTSDIHLYIKDEYNGIIVDDDSDEMVYKGMLKAIAISNGNNIRENAYKTAKQKFDYNNYIDQMKDFLKQYEKQ